MTEPGLFARELEPDSLLPSQVFTRVLPESPELRLWRAALHDAIWLYEATLRRPPLTWDECRARRWVKSDSAEFATFEYCCTLLQLDADAIREGLRDREHRLRGATGETSRRDG